MACYLENVRLDPDANPEDCRDYRRVGAALSYLEDHYRDQPSLDDVSAEVGLSPYHFQRIFTRFVGLSPKKFIQHLSLEQAKQSLAADESVLDAAFDAGLSGPGRLHDLFVSHEALTPGEWKAGGLGKQFTYGWHPSPFGDCLVVATDRGVCGLAFAEPEDRDAALADIGDQYDGAELVEDPDATAPYADLAFGRAEGNLHLVLKGTPFQIKVWQGLLRIPLGATVTYAQLARAVGAPNANRAVGSACARNPVSWLIPCHRVLRNGGAISGYRWQPGRKRAILAWEAAQTEDAAAA